MVHISYELVLILINQYIILIEPKSQVTVFVSLNGIQIQQSQEKSLLGLQTDNRPNLQFHTHVNALGKKSSSKVGLLHRLGTFLPSDYSAIIYSNSLVMALRYRSLVTRPISIVCSDYKNDVK